MAFGAPYDDFTGCVYVFVRDGAGWTQQGPKLFSPDAVGPTSFMGASLALSADGNVLAVGGHGDNQGFGAAFVYTRADGVWTQQGGKLIGSDAVGLQVHESWGLAISADASTIAFGAPFDNNLVGGTWVFTNVGGVWTQQGGKLIGTGAGPAAAQGYAITLSADGSTMGMGDYGDHNGVAAAWVFVRAADGTWSQQAGPLVVPSSGAVADYAKGTAVSLTGDGKTLAVAYAGVTVVYEERGGEWTQQGPPLIGSGAATVPVGASAVVLSADGTRMLLGGTASDSATGQRFWTFARSPDGSWAEQSAQFVATNPGWNATYGQYTSVSLSADASEIVIGRPRNLNNSGQTWAFGYTGVPGGACSSDSDCLSNSCVAGVCQCNLFCSSYVCPGDCPGGAVCTTQADGLAVCATRNTTGAAPGQECADGSQCLSGGCFNGKCGCNSHCALTPANCPGGCALPALCRTSPLGGGVCSGPGSDGLSAGAIAGIAIAAAFAVGVLVAAILFAVLRRRRRKPRHHVVKAAALEPDAVNALPCHPLPRHTSEFAGDKTCAPPSSGPASTVATLECGSVTQRTCGEDKSEQLSLLLSQLQYVREARQVLMERFDLLRPAEYRIGGQGLVHFATDAFDPSKQFAIKFFLNAQAFATERAHYASKDLRHILAPVHDVIGNESGELQVLGMPLPPAVVMERGEPLSEWTKRLQPNVALDFSNSTTIVSHLVQRVGELHAAGLAHRDLKPQNVILLPSRNEWTVIDYGSGAALGSVAPLTYSLAYAAPETVAALVEGRHTVVADAAVDVWALGIIAYEMLTNNSQVFSQGQSDVIFETMAGKRLLPWEDKASDGHAAAMQKLGFMKEMVLRMLARDPRERASLAEVNAAWSRLLQYEVGTASHSSNAVYSASTQSMDWTPPELLTGTTGSGSKQPGV